METHVHTGFTLHVTKGQRKGQVFVGEAHGLRLGRTAPCDGIFDADTVSRHHATISFDGRAFLIRDEGSVNGTFVNRVRIWGYHALTHGDLIDLGPDQQLRYECKSAVSKMFPGDKHAQPQLKKGSTLFVQYVRQRPGLIVGLGLYFSVLLALCGVLMASPHHPDRVSKEEATRAITATTRSLADEPELRILARKLSCNSIEGCLAQGKRYEDQRAQNPSALYFATWSYRKALTLAGFSGLTVYRQKVGTSSTDGGMVAQVAASLERALGTLTEELTKVTLAACTAERAGNTARARGYYARLANIVLDRRTPVLVLANQRLRALPLAAPAKK